MTTRVGLLGWPVKHSVSPPMHHAAYDALGLGWQYDLLPVEPENLTARVGEWIAAGYRGFNVTIPHKRAVLDLPGITFVDDAVEAMQAANTLVVADDGSLAIYNTDWQGFADDLAAHDIRISGAHCLILGTGGSAQAVIYALKAGGAASVTFASRQPGGRKAVIAYDDIPGRAVDLIVNTTPVGMWPAVDASPWPAGMAFPAGAALYDLIYNPPVTRLMGDAQSAGLTALGGLGMLVRQGALSIRYWTGIDPPLDDMTQAAQAALHDLTARK